jgi:hypothetical protein
MRTLLTAAGIATAALIVGVGAYVSQAEPATGTAGAGGTTTALVSDVSASVATPSPTASPTATPTATDTPTSVVDDRGGLVDRDLRVEPGDDRDARGHASDDRGTTRVDGSYDDHGSDHDAWDDHGSDDHGSDDHGSDDHGSDHD